MKLHNSDDIKTLIEKKFYPIWVDFLDFEIQRTLLAVKFTGSPNAFIILQIICWNHCLSTLSEIELKDRNSVIQKWFQTSKIGTKDNMKLSYSLVSDLSGLSVETVRRHVAKLILDGWVIYSKKEGIKFRATEENMKKLANNLNSKEVELFSKLLTKIDKQRFN